MGERIEWGQATQQTARLLWFACPTCGATVFDHAHSDDNRQRHLEWHLRKAS